MVGPSERENLESLILVLEAIHKILYSIEYFPESNENRY